MTATLDVNPVVPKIEVTPAKVESPVAVAVKPEAVTDSTVFSSREQPPDPQADLKTLLPEMARQLRAVHDQYDFYPPEALLKNGMTPERIARIREAEKELIAKNGDPVIVNMDEAFAKAIEDMATRPPVMNAAGDEATYLYSPPTGLEMNTGQAGSAPLENVTFIKINERWYLKRKGDF